MIRCPLYVGIPSSQNPKTSFEAAGATVRALDGNAWLVRRGNYAALTVLLGTKTVSTVSYRVFSVLVYQGDQWRAYRWLKGISGLVGPYTRHNAPTGLKTLLRELAATRDETGAIVALGDTLTPVVLAGEARPDLDGRDYIEGADPSGSQDIVSG
jgi:hypothetical protein